MLRFISENVESSEPMPEKKTIKRAKKAKREGKAPSTQAGEFVREEMEHIRKGKHGASSPQQAIAIGLSKARRAGVDLPPPKEGTTSKATRKRAKRDYEKGQSGKKTKPSAKRSKASTQALKRKGRSAASPKALSKHAKQAAAKRRSRGTTTTSASRRKRTRKT
jgi:hypothetical protein